MRKIICTLIMLSMMGAVQAKNIECIGMDAATNKTWKVIGNTKNDQLIINGDVFNVVSYKDNDKVNVVFTENFISESGTYVYNAIGFSKSGQLKGHWYMIQRNAATDKVIGYAQLSCSISK